VQIPIIWFWVRRAEASVVPLVSVLLLLSHV